MDNPCFQCQSSDEQIESLEYQLEMQAEETLRKLERIDNLRARLREVLTELENK